MINYTITKNYGVFGCTLAEACLGGGEIEIRNDGKI